MSEQKDNQPTKISPEIKPDPKMIQSGLFNSLGVEIVFTNKEKSPLIGIKRDEIVKTKNNNFNTEPKFYFEKENYRLGDESIHVIQSPVNCERNNRAGHVQTPAWYHGHSGF